MLGCTAHVQLWLSIEKELQSHISLDQGTGSLRVKARSKSQEATHCFEKRTAEKDNYQTQNGSPHSHQQRHGGHVVCPMLYSTWCFKYSRYPIIYSAGMTSMRCSIPCQEINFIFNGEEMPLHKHLLNRGGLFCNPLNIPEWIPALIFRRVLGLCGILKVLQMSRRSKAMLAISLAWRIPFSLGTPDTTIS